MSDEDDKKLEELRPSWQGKTAKSGMSWEEIKRRVKAGIENRRRQGKLRPAGLSEIQTGMEVAGEHFHLKRKHRIQLIRLTDLATYSLANNERTDYCAAAEGLNAIRREYEIPMQFMETLLKGVARTAAEATGEPFEVMDAMARTWLAEYFKPSDRVISLPKGEKDGGKTEH